MSRLRKDAGPDLFSEASPALGTTPPSPMPNAQPSALSFQPSSPLIASALVAESADWLSRRSVTLGNLLASERAAEYVAILRAFAVMRDGHEPEPLHEDIARMVCGEDAAQPDLAQLKTDLRQLKDWSLVTERIEKERLRGYRDNRRTKFRYRLCEDAVAFVAWLGERREHDLLPGGGDITGNLLDIQCSLLHELRRRVRSALPGKVDYEIAGDILYRVDQMRVYVEATARSLQALNLRLLGFGAESFGVAEAKEIIAELGLFLDRFGRRFGALREEIAADLTELRRETYGPRWAACAERLREEGTRFRHIAAVRIPDAAALLEDAARFYATDGRLVELRSRVGESARKVWGKLNARLRELERRNHRLEDIQARLQEFARMDEERVPYDWMRSLLECGALRGDAQIRPSGEKARPPMPKIAAKIKTRKVTSWITPRRVGDRPDVASITQVRFQRLREWMEQSGVYPQSAIPRTRLSAGGYAGFEDFPKIVSLIESLRLGKGEKARRYLDGLEGRPLAQMATVSIAASTLQFEDLELKRGEMT